MPGIDRKAIAGVGVARGPEATANWVAGGRVSAEQMRIGKKVIQAAEQNRTAEALNTAASAGSLTRSAQLVEGFGTTRNAAGEKTRTATGATPEDVRYKEAVNARKMVAEYLDSGFSGVSDKTGLIKLVVDEAIRSSNPALASEVKSFMSTFTHSGDGTEQEAFALRILENNPTLLAAVQRKLGEFVASDQARLDDGAIRAKEEAKEQARLAKEQADAEEGANNDSLTIVDASYKEFTEDTTHGFVGSRLTDIRRHETNISTKEAELITARGNLGVAEADMQRFADERDVTLSFISSNPPGTALPGGMRSTTLITRDLQDAQRRQRGNAQAIAVKEQEIRTEKERRDRLIEEKTRLEGERRTLAANKRRLEHEVKVKVSELASRTQDLQDALRLRGVQEQDIANGFKQVMQEAVQGVFDARLREYDSALAQEVIDMKAQATTDAQRLIAESLQERHYGPVTTKRIGRFSRAEIEVRPIDVAAVESDYNTLMTDGPKKLLEDILVDQFATKVNPETGAPFENPETGAPYSLGDIQKMLNKPEFVAGAQGPIVRELLAKKMMTHGINRQDIFVITGTEWGKDMVKKALETRKEYRKQIEAAMGEGILNDKTFYRKLREHMAMQPALFKFLIVPMFLSGFVGTLINDHEGHTEQGLAVA